MILNWDELAADSRGVWLEVRPGTGAGADGQMEMTGRWPEATWAGHIGAGVSSCIKLMARTCGLNDQPSAELRDSAGRPSRRWRGHHHRGARPGGTHG